MNPVEKKPKMETEIEENNSKEEEDDDNDDNEQEEALVALIEHRTKEVQHIRNRLASYKSQLDEAEKSLDDAQLKLSRIHSRRNGSTTNISPRNNIKDFKLEKRSPNHEHVGEVSLGNNERFDGRSFGNTVKEIKHEKGSPSPARVPGSSPLKPSHSKPKPSPEVVKLSRNNEGLESGSASNPRSKQQFSSPSMKHNQPSGASVSSNSQSNVSSPLQGNGRPKQNRELSRKISPDVTSEAKGVKRKFEQKEHVDLIPHLCTKSSPSVIRCQTSSVISSQHKRKLRSLELCPTNDQLFATSALDGVVNLWQIQGRGSSANLLSTTDFASAKQRRWPEDIAWHPEGSSLFAVYTADGGDTQLSILNLNKTKEKKRVHAVEQKPHIKGIINNIMFMPWEDTCFVTGGSDHAVVLWSESDGENSWKPKVLHRSLHSSAVMGVAGIQGKKIVLSAGADKRIIGFDLASGKAGYKQQVESKCMSILPNPCDFNLFLVQTGLPERQLSLFDIRLRNTELHAFGWKQESSESQSVLINQAWSPDGFYITSGSADPMIHIFDIRYNTRKPSQSIKAHQKRVFKAVWHYSMPLLISISSDLNIELHKVT